MRRRAFIGAGTAALAVGLGRPASGQEDEVMTAHVTSADGTPIAYDRAGTGAPLIIIGGILCDRRKLRDLAVALSGHVSVINFDRRGRGDSGNTEPYAVEREVEDIAALIAAAGGQAAVYGHSSGSGLALRAAADGLPIGRLILHEPPYGPDDPDSAAGSRQFAQVILGLLDGGQHGAAVETFMAAAGVPAEPAAEMGRDPALLAMAPTMRHDIAVMGELDGGALPETLVRTIAVPTLVIAGGASPDFFRQTAARVAELLPDGRLLVIEGADHGAPAEVVAPVVADFVTA
jgi:pimeloyl-ACP methyl ester carboxylesterase